MKKSLAFLLALQLVVPPAAVFAQAPPPAYAPAPANAAPLLSPAELETLVAPIALYPDPLVGLILPASTVPTDIVMASRFLEGGGDPNQIDSENWDPSVKSLTRYPDVIAMMNQNLDWTNQLGAAVIAQQPDVMTAIQAQRQKAAALGNLKTTPQQTVVVEKQVIQVVPADPQVIYVPQYNPEVVYVQAPPPDVVTPLITFGVGLAMGAWISNGCNWNNNSIYVNNWGHGGWHGYNNNFNRGYSNNTTIINNNTVINNNTINNNVWKPSKTRPAPRPSYNPNRPGGSHGTLPGVRPPPPGGWSNNGNHPNNRPPGANGSGQWNGNGNKPNNKLPGANGSGQWNGNGNKPNNMPGANGSGTYHPNTKPNTMPGANGSGTYRPNTKPENNVPGANGGGTRPETKPMPGSNGSGTYRPNTKPENTMPGANGSGTRPRPETKPSNTMPGSNGSGTYRPNSQPKPTPTQTPATRPATRPATPPPGQGGSGTRNNGGNSSGFVRPSAPDRNMNQEKSKTGGFNQQQRQTQAPQQRPAPQPRPAPVAKPQPSAPNNQAQKNANANASRDAKRAARDKNN